MGIIINKADLLKSKIPEKVEQEVRAMLEYFSQINAEKFLLKETGITPRVFNSWKNLGLISMRDQDNERKWNKFSFTEFIWLKIIQELREFGLSIEKILKVKKELFDFDLMEYILSSMENKENREPFLEYMAGSEVFTEETKASIKELFNTPELLSAVKKSGYYMSLMYMMIFNSIIKRQNNGLVIYSSGECIPWFDEYHTLHEDSKKILERPHIFISFSTFIFDFLFDEKKEQYISPLQILSKDELEILMLLKNRELKEIKIKYDDKSKPYIVEFVSGKQVSQEEADQIMKNLVLKNYQSITFKSNNNKMVYIERTHKKTF
jgi:DNA-binding transcriptional MerR regulator